MALRPANDAENARGPIAKHRRPYRSFGVICDWLSAGK